MTMLRQRLERWRSRVRSDKRTVRIVNFASGLLIVLSLALLVFPSDLGAQTVPYLCALAFLLTWVQRKSPGVVASAILTVVLAQSASAIWSIRAERRARDNEVRSRERDAALRDSTS